MPDIRETPWAKWIEETLYNLMEFKPTKIALMAVNAEGETMSAWTGCDPLDLFGMAGALHADAMWLQMEANGDHLKQIIENGESEDDQD